MKKQALLIGRFQPLHNGHVSVVNKLKNFGLEKIVLGIGVEGKGRTEKNPFFFDEVKRMWLPIAKNYATDIATEIYKIPDINDFGNYAKHVENITGVSKLDTVLVSGNPRTLECFPDYEKLTLEPQIPLRNKTYLCASYVRELIVNGGCWEDFVPESTKKIIETVGLDEITNAILNKNNDIPIYSGHVNLVKRFYKDKNWDVVVSKNACAIIYIDENDFVYFTKQYRVPLNKEILELPAETMDKNGKSSLQVIVEGLEEECGVRICTSQVKYFTTIESSGGHDTEMVDLFYAYGKGEFTNQCLEDHEQIDVVKIQFKQAYDMIKSGELEGSKTVALLQHEYIKRLETKASKTKGG